MGVLLDRPYGPTSGAASVPNQIPLNAQATATQTAAGPLPATLVLLATAEVLVPSVALASVPLTVQLKPDTTIEQTIFDVVASGIISTLSTTNLTLKLYSGAAIVSGNLLKSSGTVAQNTVANANFYIKASLLFNSVSGKLSGTVKFYINDSLVAEAVITNFPGTFLNVGNPSANPPTVANLPEFCFSLTSSGADGTHATTLSCQKFSCG